METFNFPMLESIETHTCGLLDSSAELATASNPTYAKKTTVDPVKMAFTPLGAKGDQLETSISKEPANMTKITITTCRTMQLLLFVQIN